VLCLFFALAVDKLSITCGETVVEMWIAGVSALFSGFCCWLAARSLSTSARQAPTKWNLRLSEVTQELIELRDLIEQIQATMKKRSARDANTSRYRQEGEPDPAKDPVAWKQWANSGGLRQYLRK